MVSSSLVWSNSPYDNSTASYLIDWKPVPPVLGELVFYLVIPGANHDFAHRFALATWPWLRKGCTRNGWVFLLGYSTDQQPMVFLRCHPA